MYIMACHAHPALEKIGPALVPFFILDSPLACIHVLDYKSVRTSPPVYELKGQRTVSHRA